MTAAVHPPPPLAPRNILEIWATAVLLLRRHPLPFVGSALVLTLAGDLVLWAWSALVTPLTTSGATREQLVQLSVLSLLLGQAVVLAVFALTGALQAVLVVQALTGEPVTIRTALRLLARRIRPVLGVTALLTVVPQLVVLGLIAALGAFFSGTGFALWPTGTLPRTRRWFPRSCPCCRTPGRSPRCRCWSG
ncbi:hypothetical protein ACFSTC_43255 [Nonomuraea ferruginea]